MSKENLYDVIKKPLITEKSVSATESGKYTFEVRKDATKVEIAKAVELEKIDSKYSTHELKTVFNKELYFVEHHEYKYKKDSLIPSSKSISELQNFMHNATYHIKSYYYNVLGDIKLN